MCATNIWAVNAAAYTPDFERFTTESVGVAPRTTNYRIASDRVRPSAVTFTLTRNMCDCASLIGLRDSRERADETSANAWLGWMRELPAIAPHVSRLAVFRAWSAEDDHIAPDRTTAVSIDELDEPLLRSLDDNALLTVDYEPS